MKHIDCRGLACPGPVIQAKKALEETPSGESFCMELDSESSRENVLRFVRSRGAEAVIEDPGDGTVRLVITSPWGEGSFTDAGTQGPAFAEASDFALRASAFAEAMADRTTDKMAYRRGEAEYGRRGHKPAVVFIASDRLGDGDEKLGRILMEGFVNSLGDQGTVPDKLLLMNGGVRLAVEGSLSLPTLRVLTDRGCEILVCGTCLDYFSLKEKLAVGTVSNMFEIQGALLGAESVIRV